MNCHESGRIDIEGARRDLEDIERFLRTGQEWLKKQHEEGLSGGEFCQNRSALDGRRAPAALEEGRRLPERKGFQPGDFPDRHGRVRPGGTEPLLRHRPPSSPSSGKGKDLAEWVQALLHPLWDWGLTVGYTVQTPKETLRAAGRDLDLFLSFLDARWVAGDKGLFLRWEEEFSREHQAGKGKGDDPPDSATGYGPPQKAGRFGLCPRAGDQRRERGVCGIITRRSGRRRSSTRSDPRGK